MNRAGVTALLATGLLLAAGSRAAASIPERPEGLVFPPLRYEPPEPADHRVELSNGIVAYLVPDAEIPLVAVDVLMRIGPDLDPPGKEGLAEMAVHLLTRGGTKTRSAADLEARVAFLGAALESGIGGSFAGRGPFGPAGPPIGPAEARAGVNLLSKDLDEGLALLADCLRDPAFEEERISLRRDQVLQQMRRRNDETSTIEEREWSRLLRGEGHWSNRLPTEASVRAITREDLADFARRWVGPKNFVLAVSGDFDRAAMVKRLEKAFRGWPSPGERPGPPPAPAAPPARGFFLVDKDVNQARVSIGCEGLARDDPDIHAARVMNQILGGGGFTSRLVNRIRSDEGLAYSVGSRLGDGVYYAEPWRLVFQSKVRSVAYAEEIAFGEIAKMRDSLVTPAELEDSKSGIVEAFPAQFASAAQIAGALAHDELTGRYARAPDYWATYRDRIAAVTAEEVRAVARRLLDPSRMAVLMVGKASDILLGDPKRDARVEALAGGPPARLPLRDPMTLKPLETP
jgi:zinc protease